MQTIEVIRTLLSIDLLFGDPEVEAQHLDGGSFQQDSDSAVVIE